MASDRVKINEMASAVMESLTEYADLAADEMKKAVQTAGKTVKKEIEATAPKDTGAYAKSWAVKKVKETSQSMDVVVYSKTKYQLAHLLEHGHALRNGGRVKAYPHIAPAEEKGLEKLETELKKGLS
ncbi:MAG: HK97 gp10 family phage protein [Lachnospiraceae bacterium]|nr:HK97 gp10 family phage protein [Lachnospiraceae bacterium]